MKLTKQLFVVAALGASCLVASAAGAQDRRDGNYTQQQDNTRRTRDQNRDANGNQTNGSDRYNKRTDSRDEGRDMNGHSSGDRQYRSGNRGRHDGWQRGNHYGWQRGHHYGWQRHCAVRWHHHHQVRVCR